MKAHPTWLCPTCQSLAVTPFCPRCGETLPRRLTVRELARDAFEAVSSVDGKLLRSLRALVLHPGKLTAAYAAGQRKPYVGPLALFLAANALFFAVQSAVRSNIFASSLASHLSHQDWSPLARALTERRLAAKGTTLEAFAPLFDQAAILNAKALIVLMPLTFCLLPAMLFVQRRRPMAVHAVFALHLYAFLLLVFCLSLGIAAASQAVGGPGVEAPAMDVGLSLLNLLVSATYLQVALGKAYELGPLARTAGALALAAAMGALVLGYRLAVFAITLWTT